MFISQKSQRLAITGLGGVGKTQVALTFSYVVKEKYSNYSIFWVSALSIGRFKQDYTKIAKECSIGAGFNEAELIQIVQDYLSNVDSGKWLLVVDNSDDQTLLFNNDIGIIKYLPQSENGITIFTTRYRHIAVDVADRNILHLEAMNLEEAKMLLQKSLGRGEEEKIMEDLLEELTYLPLAINQASSYMIKSSITIAEYLELMRDTEEEMVKLLSRDIQDSSRGNTRNAIAVTWLISFDLIKRDEPNAADMLFFLASLENKAIPHSILPVNSKGDMVHAIGVLTGYSFLTKQEDSEIYDMHRLVHLAVKTWMRKENVVDYWKVKTIEHLANIFPFDEWENRSIWQAYVPHTLRVLQDTEQMISERRAVLCLRLGQCLLVDGRTSEAVKWCKECFLWRKLSLFEEDAELLQSQHELAVAYRSNGQVKEAVELLEKVVAIRARVLAEDHPGRLASQHALAVAYELNGQVKEAIELLEKVVAIEARVQAEDHPDRLASQHALAVAYRSNGQVKEAVELLEKVVAIRARVLAEDHPGRLASQHALAVAYELNGQVKEAIELLEKVVAIEARVQAEDHPDRLASQHNLALYYESSDQINKAVSLMQHVVTVQQKYWRADHPDRIIAERSLSRMLRERAAEGLLGGEAQQLAG